MATKKRAFRSEESYEQELITRDKIVSFLEQRGFKDLDDVRSPAGKAQSQVVTARMPNGEKVRMRVRLCWRRDGRKQREKKYSAAQLCKSVKNDDWKGTLRSIMKRDADESITHSLIVQRDGDDIIYAALLPRDQLLPVWLKQRDVSSQLIEKGVMGRIRKNHAMNGQSPTIWLQDDRTDKTHAVADALWSHDGVMDIAKLSKDDRGAEPVDDTFDDYHGLDLSLLGSDNPPRIMTLRSAVKRDPQVRKAVLNRAKNQCERRSCGATRSYLGFLDVHHILGAEKSDRVFIESRISR